MEDLEVVSRVRRGELDAFRAIVTRYHRPLFYFVVGRMTVDGKAEDIVQKTFVTAYRNLGDYDVGKPLLPWLRGIALNHCRNEWKRFRRSAEATGSLADRRLADAELEALAAPTADEDDRRVEALQACLGHLGEQQRRLLELRFVEEFPLEVIGQRLARSGEAVRLMLFRLRLRLGDCVKRRLALPGEVT